MFRRAIKQTLVVLLGWVEIGMPEGKPIVIPPVPHRHWVFFAPPFQPLVLHFSLSVPSRRIRDVRRLGVVR